MNDIMLFGEGWNGEVRQIEQGLQEFHFIPNPHDPRLREAIFAVTTYQSDNGDIYLMGWSGIEPMQPDVEEAILRNRPTPI